VGRFNSGAFRIILERAPLPVLSAAVDGGWRIGKLKGLVKNFGRTRYRIRLLALHPAPRGKSEILETLGKVEREIRAQMDDWQAGRA
jgi:1-acyl-sn-glycerol-3-phosphate acyltransferase